MTDDKEFSELLNGIAVKSLQLIARWKERAAYPAWLDKWIDLMESIVHFLDVIFLKNPQKLMIMQLSYWEEARNMTLSLFSSWLDGKPIPTADKRFCAKEWSEPFFHFLSQQYLLICKHWDSLLNMMEYSDQNSARRLRIFSKHYIDALSPANFFHTNPQVMMETINSQGKNVLQGLHNLLSDLEKDSLPGKIAMVYPLGQQLASTPGKVIFRNKMMELIQYTAQTTKVKALPLLIVPPWINKYYILDLSPHNSLIRWLVAQGITVFVISWVNPNASFAKKGLEDYLQEGPITAIATIQKQLGVKQVNALGFCIGGTLLAMLLAYNKAQQNQSINSASFLAAMIDFSDPGDLGVFIGEEQIKKLEKEMDSKGYLSGKIMASSFNSLKANELIWSAFIKNYLSGKKSDYFDVLLWNADSTNMPATMHSQYLRWMYLNNDLVKPGKIQLNNTPINIGSIDNPTFFLATEKDHIAPWKTSYRGFELMQGPKRFVLGGSGHIAGIINSPKLMKYGFKTNASMTSSAEEWLEQAKFTPGSWWPEWFKWLKKHSGKEIVAPKWSRLPLIPLMDAPGSYVKQNCEQG